MIVSIDGMLSFDAAACGPLLVERLRERLSVPDPVWERASKRARTPRQHERLARMPSNICAVEEVGARVYLPRGCLGVLRAAAAECGIAIEWDARGVVGLAPEPMAFDGKLREDQWEAVETALERRQGLIVAPTGAGKTVIGCALVGRIGQPAVVVAPTKDIVSQWADELRRFLGLEAGICADGRRETEALVTVGTPDTLAALSEAQGNALAARCALLLWDEVDHGGDRMREIVNAMPARWRIGLTATPGDGPKRERLEWLFGPVIYESTHQELAAEGRVLRPRIETVETGWTWDLRAYCEEHELLDEETGEPPADAWEKAYGPLLDAACESPERNEAILALAEREWRAGRSVLVLSGRVAHCQALAEVLVSRGVEAVALTAKLGRKPRREAVAALKANTLRCVCATQLADRALDVPFLERVVMAFPGRSRRQVVQRIGRALRPAEKAAPVVFDLVDDVPLLRGQAAARRRVYKEVFG